MPPDTPDILKKILARKAEEITERSNRVDIRELGKRIENMSPPRPFADALRARIDKGQAAVIAGLLKAPSRYSPLSNEDAAMGRMAVVLEAMGETDVGPPAIVSQSLAGSEQYYADWIMARLPDLVGQSSGDMVVHTRHDPAVQRAATRALQQGLEQWGESRDVLSLSGRSRSIL